MQRRNFLKTTSLAGLTLTTMAAGRLSVLAESTTGNAAPQDAFILSEINN